MNTRSISTIQLFIALGAVLYVVAPDVFFGPFDDAAVATIATIADIILGIVKSRISASPATYLDDDF